MKHVIKFAALAFAVTLLTGAPSAQHSSPPGGARLELDGTTAKTFAASVEKARRSLSARDRKRFDESLELARRLFPNEEAYRKQMHGTPLRRALEIGDKMRQHLDTNRDGKISDRELRVASSDMEHARVRANESAAMATLLNCASAQALTQAAGVIDVNGNGNGEYGFFAEMTGVVGVRDEKSRPSTLRMSPPVLPRRFKVKDGLVESSGYLYQMWLPAADGTAVSEGKRGGIGVNAPDPENAELAWCAYAWPVEYGVTGNRAFFVTQDGDVYETDNKNQRYSGRRRAPSPYAGFPKGVKKLGFLPRKLPVSNDKGGWTASF